MVATRATVSPCTMLQIAPAAASPGIRPVFWGYVLAGTPANPPDVCLMDTGAVFASGLTAHVAAGITKWNVPSGEASTVQLGTALTGYATATLPTEGSPTATRLLDYKREPGVYYLIQEPLGREPEVAPGNCLRIVATPSTAAAVSMVCFVGWEE